MKKRSKEPKEEQNFWKNKKTYTSVESSYYLFSVKALISAFEHYISSPVFGGNSES